MLARTMSATVLGVDGVAVRVEVDVALGLPGMTIVGLAGSAVLEARERVRSALRNSGFRLPERRITVNLAPADLPKDGTSYDAAIAVGLLAASGQLEPIGLDETALIGELALDGGLRPVPGTMALVAAAAEAGLRAAIVPSATAEEAATVPGLVVHGADSLAAVVAHLAGRQRLVVARPPAADAWRPPVDGADLAAVRGQRMARRLLEIAVAGHHSVALCGPPGVGKTLLLRCATGLLPPLEDGEATEVSRIYSVAGLLDRSAPLIRHRPVRTPHHTISTQALVGGGPRIRPGEASLAHRGLLVLDELLHFRTDALDALRQPIESGTVTIARVEGVLRMPARFTLLAAFNPCPCGMGLDRSACRCDEGTRRRYQGRLSGPLRDRIDLFGTMPLPSSGELDERAPEPSSVVRERVAAAWCRQVGRQGHANGELGPHEIDRRHGFPDAFAPLLEQRGRRLGVSPRRLHRAARVARTIADLEGSETVTRAHLDEALHPRAIELAA